MRGVYTHKLCDGMYTRMHVQRSVSLHVVCEGTCARVQVRGQPQGFSTEYARLAGQRASGDYLCLPFCRSTGLTDTHYCTHLYVGAGDSKPGPHACEHVLFTHVISPAQRSLFQLRELGG